MAARKSPICAKKNDPTWTEPQSFSDRVRGRVTVGGVSVPRSLAEQPQEGYAILEMDRTNQLATVLVTDPRQLEGAADAARLTGYAGASQPRRG